MEIITRNRVESLEDYIAQNLDSDGGLCVEIDGDYIENSFSVCELAERIEAELVRIQQKEMA